MTSAAVSPEPEGGVDPLLYRQAAGRYATGVTVVTTRHAGRQHAMTVNSLTSVSLDPVLLLFCAEKVARFHDAVLASGSWAVSVLGSGQEDVSRYFATRGRPADEHQFDAYPHHTGAVTGAVVFDGAIAALECRTVSLTDGGDHTVVLGEVVGLELPPGPAEPLVYYEGRYRSVPPG